MGGLLLVQQKCLRGDYVEVPGPWAAVQWLSGEATHWPLTVWGEATAETGGEPGGEPTFFFLSPTILHFQPQR